MTDRLSLTWSDVEQLVNSIVRDIHLSQWMPDLIVGVDRGGLPASTMISHYLQLPHESVKVSLRDYESTASILWLPEDVIEGKKILLVDDINDSGATQTWLKNDWSESVAGVEVDFIEKFWHNSVRWASLVNNDASSEESDYVGMSVNKLEQDIWIDFPWESWWARSTK
jgi:hypothetical protein